MIPLVTAFIAAVVAVIAFLQWQTAREKVLLDLFDKRFDVYDELRSVLRQRSEGGFDTFSLIDFERAATRAQFLFGPEVQTFLHERVGDLVNESVDQYRVKRVNEDQRAEVEAQLASIVERLSHFVRDLDKLVAPYMNHHQQALTWPS